MYVYFHDNVSQNSFSHFAFLNDNNELWYIYDDVTLLEHSWGLVLRYYLTLKSLAFNCLSKDRIVHDGATYLEGVVVLV